MKKNTIVQYLNTKPQLNGVLAFDTQYNWPTLLVSHHNFDLSTYSDKTEGNSKKKSYSIESFKDMQLASRFKTATSQNSQLNNANIHIVAGLRSK